MIILEGKIYPMHKLGDFMICWMLESNHCTKVAEMVIHLYHLLQD